MVAQTGPGKWTVHASVSGQLWIVCAFETHFVLMQTVLEGGVHTLLYGEGSAAAAARMRCRVLTSISEGLCESQVLCY